MQSLDTKEFLTLIENVRSRDNRSLVHCFMNSVAANDCANAILAAGARPVMADSADECAEITAHAGSLVLNMGTFSKEKGRAMLLSGKAANRAGIPVIIDPVGVQASSLRKEWFGRFMSEIDIFAVKGNAAEIQAVCKGEESNSVLAVRAAKQLGCTVLVTGETDILSDGCLAYKFSNGSSHLANVTGTGCITGALIGVFAAESDPLTACAAAVSLMNICGEKAAEKYHGTGSFRTELMDLLSQITYSELVSHIRMEKLEFSGHEC